MNTEEVEESSTGDLEPKTATSVLGATAQTEVTHNRNNTTKTLI